MCVVNHVLMARPGYLIDAQLESVAAKGALFTRMLGHHEEVGLSDEQVRELLTLSREYHDKQLAIHIEASQVGESLELKWGRAER